LRGTPQGGGFFKKLVLGAVVLVVLLVGAVAAVPFFIDWEDVRKLAEEKGTQALGRKVRIKKLRVSLFSGVEVEGFQIGPRPGTSQKPLIQADRVIAKYRLLPLFFLRVVIHKVELVEPKLYLDRNRRGRWSFADLTKPAPTRKTKAAAPAKPVILPIEVNVDTVRITDGSLMFKDASLKPPLSAGMEELNLTMRDFNLAGQPASIDLSMQVKVNGHVVPVRLEGDFGLHLNRSLLILHRLTVTVPGVKAVTSGEIKQFQTLPTLSIQERITVDLAAVWNHFKEFADRELRDQITPSGAVTVDADIRGIVKKIKFRGKVKFHNVSVKHAALPGTIEGLEGSMNFDEDRVSTSNLRFIAIDNPFTFMCDIKGLNLTNAQAFEKFSPKGKFVLESPKVVLDKFIPLNGVSDGKETAGQTAKGAPPPKEPDMRGIVPRGVDLSGEVRFHEIKARKLTVTGMVLGVRIAKGDLSYTLNSKLYAGTQSASGKVALTKYPLRYSAEMKLKGFQAGKFLHDSIDSFFENKDLVKGRLSGATDMEVKLSGKGVTFPSLKKWLTGNGRFMVTEGKISEFRFFDTLMEFLGGSLGKAMKLGQKYKLDKKAKLDVLPKDLSFKSLSGSFTIAKGTITMPDLVMDPGVGGDLGVTYKGTVTFEMALKGKMKTRFHPRHTDQLMKTMVFTKENGWAACDWSVSGTVARPKLVPSTKQVKKKVKAVVKEEAKKQLKKHQPALEKKAKEVGKKLLKKFFK